MELCWLKKEGRSSCILFLAGWGMDPAPFRNVPVEHDLLMAFDYLLVDPVPVMELTRGYDSLHLVAWSMGVWVAGTYLVPWRHRFTSTLAVNGTLKPIDDECGIPAGTFASMLRGISPALLNRFYQDMFAQPEHMARFLESPPSRSLDSMAAELEALQQDYLKKGPGEDIFSSKIVGTRDRIFQARSQQRSWGKGNCILSKTGHFPFYGWSSWDSVIAGRESL